MVEEVPTENYVEEEIRLSQKLAVNCFFKYFFLSIFSYEDVTEISCFIYIAYMGVCFCVCL